MTKDVLIKMPLIFVKPRRYFKGVITKNTFTLSDLGYLNLMAFSIVLVYHLFQSQMLESAQNGLEQGVYLVGFTLGWVLSFAFRTYYLSMLLTKTGVAVDYRKIAMVVGMAFSPYLIMMLSTLFVPTAEYNQFINIAMQSWNLLLILIGVVGLTDIGWPKAALFVLSMFGIESLFEYLFSGIAL